MICVGVHDGFGQICWIDVSTSHSLCALSTISLLCIQKSSFDSNIAKFLALSAHRSSVES